MNLSDRDKKLLIFLGVIIVGFVVYTWGYKPLNRQKDQLAKEVQSLESKYKTIQTQQANQATYENEIQEFKKEIEHLDDLLPPILTQEKVIVNMDRIQNFTDVTFKGLTFSEVEVKGDGDTPIDLSDTKENEGKNLPSNLKVKMAIQTNYSCNYEQLKGLLDYMYHFDDRVVIDNINVTMGEEGILSGAMNLSFYGLMSPDRPIVEAPIDNIPVGKPSLMTNYKYESIVDKDYTNMIRPDKNKDFFVLLYAHTSDLPTVMVGANSTVNASQYALLSSNFNTLVPIEIQVLQKDAKYFYKYKIGGKTHPSNYSTEIEFNPGEKLELSILSNPRVSSEDLSGVNATVINKTDMPLYIVKEDDDGNRPRFNIIKQEGQIIVQ